MRSMALTFSSSSLRVFKPSVGWLSVCRWNSTTSYQQPTSDRNRNPTLRPRRRVPNRQRFIEDQRAQGESKALERFITREWKAGDIYAPHDLSAAEMKKWKRSRGPSRDIFDAVNVNPLDLYKNFAVMSEYMTSMGRIKHRRDTGLRPVNQRKIAKAIRRAIGVGLMPSVHRHPEILAAEARSRMESL